MTAPPPIRLVPIAVPLQHVHRSSKTDIFGSDPSTYSQVTSAPSFLTDSRDNCVGQLLPKSPPFFHTPLLHARAPSQSILHKSSRFCT